jgi:hypothetical protein
MFCFGAGTVLYEQPYPLQPSVSISVPSNIDLGSVTPSGQQIFNSDVKAYIAAHCPYHTEVEVTLPLGA